MLITNMSLMSIKSIQKPAGQLRILVYLYRNEKTQGKDIKHKIGLNAKTASLALANLVELKLVRELKNDYYKLYKRGQRVAEHLDRVDKLL